MGFWHLALIMGLITWTACVFLRAVAARTYLLRLELVPIAEEPYEATVKAGGPGPCRRSRSPQMAEVLSKHQPGKNGHARPSGNGKPGSNGNGHGKIPVKRPLR